MLDKWLKRYEQTRESQKGGCTITGDMAKSLLTIVLSLQSKVETLTAEVESLKTVTIPRIEPTEGESTT